MARLGEHADRLDLLATAAAEREAKLAELWDLVQSLLPENGGAGAPVPTPRWHVLEGQERAAAVARLASWGQAVYLPGYGHLAGGLGDCWPNHPPALGLIHPPSATCTQL